MTFFFRFFQVLSLSLCAVAVLTSTHVLAAEDMPPAYVLDDTEVHNIAAPDLQRNYQIFVSLPPSYRESDRKYPVVFVTDANYAFPLIRAISRRISNHGKDVEDFILVGLSYAVGDTPEYSRRRDYTPTTHGGANEISDMPGRMPAHGEAEGYRRFIAQQVFPFVASHYRADMRRTVFAGHSYGALLGTHILFSDPGMFQYYVLGSPSLWYDKHVMFAREKEYAAAHKDLPAKVMMAVGSFETIKPGSHDSRYNSDDDMLRDMQQFERALKSRHYPQLSVQSQVIADENHLTVAPAIITRGLLWALGAQDKMNKESVRSVVAH
jgi:predicted alpha/beta superfamily hydrolase